MFIQFILIKFFFLFIIAKMYD